MKLRNFVFAPGLMALAACAHPMTQAPGSARTHDGDRVGVTETTSAATPGKSPSLNVSSELMRRCNLHFDSAEEAPRFGFDDSKLDPQDQAVLAQIAKCVTDGPLAGRSVRLVGRADPRGETEYNMALGARRADSAERFLIQLGVVPSRVRETSRGELDANGNDEAGWARDRRVDVVLE